VRSNNFAPYVSSSLLICMLNAGWTTFSRTAAFVTLRSS
jgi:hypothetical protein